MRRFRVPVLVVFAVLIAFSAVLVVSPSVAARAPAPPTTHSRSATGRFTILGHTVRALKGAHASGATDGARALSLSIALSPQHTDALDALIRAQNDPTSGLYHHYITPADYNAMFAPSQATVDQVTAFLRGQGILVRGVSSNHLLIDADGSVASVEHAFGVRIANFSFHGRQVYAPTNDPSVPAALAGMIVNIGGLDDVAHLHPLVPLMPNTGPGGGYTPSELRTAYDMNSLESSANGSGQTVAIFELDGYVPSDVNAYLSYYGLGSAKYSNVLVDGATNTAGAGAIEVELDMEDVSAIAPGANQKIYIGPNSTQGVNDTYNKIVTDDLAKVTSTSWGECESSAGTSELQAEDNIFQQGAAQGQAFFAAAGDSGAYDCGGSALAVDNPADDPYVVGVGGTTLNTGSGGSYGSESVWGSGTEGGGGGLSTYFSQPSYQSGPGVQNQYSNGMREVPDVSADADPNTGYSIYCTVAAAGCGSGWTEVGGTSAAAPLWAAVATDTNQYLAANSKPVLGSASSEVYHLFNTSQTYTAYHDITSGTNLYYPATSGYDLASGIGSPDVWNFARDAAGTSSGGNPPTISSFSPTSGPVGTSVTITGSSFTGTTAVKFNGTSASFTVNSDTQISTTVPSGATTGTISVTNGTGTGTSSGSFTVTTSGGNPPTVSSFSPTSGPVGTSVTITGTNFTGVTAVKFNSTAATSYTVNSSTQITATVPSGATTGKISVTNGSGTGTSSGSFTVTTGGQTAQLIVNGGFENGQSPWQESSAGGYQIIDPTNPHTGSYSAWLCGYDACSDKIWQTVTIPSTMTSATWSFWLYIDTAEASGSPCYDYFYARIQTSSGATISTPLRKCNSNATNSWVPYTLNVTSALSAYKGQTVRIAFIGTTDYSLPTDFFVDDTTLTVNY